MDFKKVTRVVRQVFRDSEKEHGPKHGPLPDAVYELESWNARTSTHSFSIVYDPNTTPPAYTASWKPRPDKDGKQPGATFIGEVPHPETKLPWFDTFTGAQRACEAQWKTLRRGLS